MAKTIGKNHKGNHCANCSEPFEWPEFSAYMMRLKSTTIDCVRCQTENYLVPEKGLKYWLMILLSILAGLAVFFGMQLAFAISTYNEFTGTYRVSGVFLILGAVFGVALPRFMMNIYIWKSGQISLDKKHKSIADYE